MLETRQYQRIDSVQEDTKDLKSRKDISLWNDDSLKNVMVALDSLKLWHQYEELRKSNRNSETGKKVSDLNIRYSSQFSKISIKFETWAAQRRLLIQKLRTAQERIEKVRVISCVGKVIFSSADVIGTVSALVLQNYERKWSTSLLFAAGTLGMVSVGCSLAEVMQVRSIMQEALVDFRKDKELLQEIQVIFQDMDKFDKCVQGLFPYGIDWNVMEFIQRPGFMDPVLQKEFEKMHKVLGSHTENLVSLAILLSNIPKDPELQNDDSFLHTVEVFSKSPFAEKWWNRKRCPPLRPYSKKSSVLYEMNTFLKHDINALQGLPMVTMQILYLNTFTTLLSVLVNTLVAAQALWNLKNDGDLSAEREVLKKLERILSEEYVKVTEIYDLINPHYD